MKKGIPIAIIGLMMMLSSCMNKNLMEYYYPINEEVEIKVYKYVSPNNKDLTEYWKTTIDPSEQTILTESFNSEMDLYNIFKEKVEKDKATLLGYSDYETQENETAKEVLGTIKKDRVYNSNKIENYSYAVEYTNKYGQFSFEKRRTFLKFEKIEIQGKKYNTAKFQDEYFINEIDKGTRYKFKQETYYAKKLGMVKYERFLSNGDVKILELEKILTEAEFEQLK